MTRKPKTLPMGDPGFPLFVADVSHLETIWPESPSKGDPLAAWKAATHYPLDERSIGLYLAVATFPGTLSVMFPSAFPHALVWFFVEGKWSEADRNNNIRVIFREVVGDLVIVDTGERFWSGPEALERALALPEQLREGNVNVVLSFSRCKEENEAFESVLDAWMKTRRENGDSE